MSDETTLPAKSSDWTKIERELYGGCQARVLGDRDWKDKVLVELLSGPLAGSRIWMDEEDLRKDKTA
jgi:hypothetical protein